jgi:hypothetical protein
MSPTTLTRVYVAFDFDDRKIAAMMGAQLRNPNAGYDVANWSLKEARPEASWETDAEYKIKRSDLLMIVLGRNTHRADGVRKEVAIARRADVRVPCCQIAPASLGSVTPVPNGGHWYRWNQQNLLSLVSQARREI